MKRHVNIRVRGIVQGVGFRPFVYKLARSLGLSGTVRNDTEGVLIALEGDGGSIDRFITGLERESPPLSSIQSVTVNEGSPEDISGFRIEASANTERRSAFLPPDTCLCDACLQEFFSAGDRRHHYPFITCTHCGPRFSIVDDIPYDRINTSMRDFTMCPVCASEYADPEDRRFHTQPNACPECGPSLSLRGKDGSILTDGSLVVARETVRLLNENAIIAIKGVGGYLLAVNAKSDIAVLELRKRKARPFKPFALMAGSIERIGSFLEVSTEERKLLLSKERPIVLLKERDRGVSDHIAPRSSFQGIMLPYMPFQFLLFSIDPDMILVMTSGNISDEPIEYRDESAFARLGAVADYFVTYNRDIRAQSDDSVLFVERGARYFVRRSRGYVPVPFVTRKTGTNFLATGGDLKNSFALARDDIHILSQYLGDLSTPAGNELYRKTIDHFMRIYDFHPGVVISDLHPGYFTTAFADELEESGLRRIGVQHHHAHVVSVMEEHDIDEAVIGIAFDGTGFGPDGVLWGSEFLLADRSSFTREAYFSPFPLPGGERAIRDVWKIGLSLLYDHYGRDLPGLYVWDSASAVLEIIDKKINSPLTCSIGRIFDGISAILGLCSSISTEAEAAMLLEEAAVKCPVKKKTGFTIPFQSGSTVLDTGALIGRVNDMVISKRYSQEEIAFFFHDALARTAVEVACQLREQYGNYRVVLSGGVFQNRLLLGLMLDGLKGKRFDIFTPRKVPFNDGGIAIGQLAAAKEMVRNG